MAELPHLVQLHEKYSGRVHAISLNVDHEADSLSPELEQKVADTLTRLHVRCDNVLCMTPREEVFDEWGIFSIPAVVIFDSQGRVHRVIDGKVDYESDVMPLVDKMLQAEGLYGQSD